MLIGAVIAIGSLGYSIIEKWSLFEGLYMTVITIATVGFHEVHALSEQGKLFTIFIIFAGIGVGGYAIGNITSFFIGGEARKIFMETVLEKKLSRLKDHIILLGYGKFGAEIADEVDRKRVPLVIIENDEKKVERAREKGFQAYLGDGTDEQMLEKVGVRRARGMVAALSTEAANVYAVLTGRVLNPDMVIVSRGEEEESEKKMLRAGANRVILAYRSGGRRMAAVVLEPAILDFLDIMFSGDELAVELMSVTLKKDSLLVGKMLKDADLRDETGGVLIVGIKDKSGNITSIPVGTTVLNEGDKLIVMGSNEHIDALKKLTG